MKFPLLLKQIILLHRLLLHTMFFRILSLAFVSLGCLSVILSLLSFVFLLELISAMQGKHSKRTGRPEACFLFFFSFLLLRPNRDVVYQYICVTILLLTSIWDKKRKEEHLSRQEEEKNSQSWELESDIDYRFSSLLQSMCYSSSFYSHSKNSSHIQRWRRRRSHYDEGGWTTRGERKEWSLEGKDRFQEKRNRILFPRKSKVMHWNKRECEFSWVLLFRYFFCTLERKEVVSLTIRQDPSRSRHVSFRK